jgi:SLT domain-containing protein
MTIANGTRSSGYEYDEYCSARRFAIRGLFGTILQQSARRAGRPEIPSAGGNGRDNGLKVRRRNYDRKYEEERQQWTPFFEQFDGFT